MTIQRKPPVDPSSNLPPTTGDVAPSEAKRAFSEHLDAAKEKSATERTANLGATSAAASANQAEGVSAASPLARLRRGEIDVSGYADAKVDEATQHLQHLPASELSSIREMLRDKLMSDPELRELVTQATGKAPPELE